MTKTFETELLSESSSPFLVELFIKLLRLLTKIRFIGTENWQTFLRREFGKRELEEPIEIPEDADFFSLSLRTKLLIIHNLCEWQFEDPERFRSSIKNEDDAVSWRVDPVGYDSKGNTYWLFDDNRLYRQNTAAPSTPKKSAKGRRGRGSSTRGDSSSKSDWTLVCLTAEDWTNLPEQFRKSRNAAEKELSNWLTEHALPKVLADLEAKEKARKLQEAMNNRKRSSRLQMRELEKIEQERQHALMKEREEMEKRMQSEDEKRRRDDQERQYRAEARDRRIREREQRLKLQAEGKLQPQQRRRSRRKEEEEEEAWYFDCICGVHGDNLDDGSPMIACGQCNVWQHIACVSAYQQQPAKTGGDGKVPDASDIQKWEEMDFICARCLRIEAQGGEDATDKVEQEQDNEEESDEDREDGVGDGESEPDAEDVSDDEERRKKKKKKKKKKKDRDKDKEKKKEKKKKRREIEAANGTRSASEDGGSGERADEEDESSSEDDGKVGDEHKENLDKQKMKGRKHKLDDESASGASTATAKIHVPKKIRLVNPAANGVVGNVAKGEGAGPSTTAGTAATRIVLPASVVNSAGKVAYGNGVGTGAHQPSPMPPVPMVTSALPPVPTTSGVANLNASSSLPMLMPFPPSEHGAKPPPHAMAPPLGVPQGGQHQASKPRKPRAPAKKKDAAAGAAMAGSEGQQQQPARKRVRKPKTGVEGAPRSAPATANGMGAAPGSYGGVGGVVEPPYFAFPTTTAPTTMSMMSMGMYPPMPMMGTNSTGKHPQPGPMMQFPPPGTTGAGAATFPAPFMFQPPPGAPMNFAPFPGLYPPISPGMFYGMPPPSMPVGSTAATPSSTKVMTTNAAPATPAPPTTASTGATAMTPATTSSTVASGDTASAAAAAVAAAAAASMGGLPSMTGVPFLPPTPVAPKESVSGASGGGGGGGGINGGMFPGQPSTFMTPLPVSTTAGMMYGQTPTTAAAGMSAVNNAFSSMTPASTEAAFILAHLEAVRMAHEQGQRQQ
ncbi:hypothetical protein HK102_007281 [Quaeritorhiza haematococci]|nr:hypothetical protein HK102_007281 [Quaeritorhiza haematococci]